MSVALVVGAHIILLGLLTSHARKMAKGEVPEREIWKDTGTFALISFCLLIVLAFVDIALRFWRGA